MPVKPPPFPKISRWLFESLVNLPDEEQEANKEIMNKERSIRFVISKFGYEIYKELVSIDKQKNYKNV
jgi:hypothetical protein